MSQWITSCLTEGWQWEASEIALLGSTHLRGPFPQCSLYRSWEHSISDLYNIRPTASCGPREFLLQHVRAFSIAHGSPKALLRIINCLSNIGVGSGEFGCEGFLSVIPKLAQKVIVRLLPTNFLLQISWRSFLVWPRKKGLRVFFCFLQTLGAIFARIFRVLPRFSRILPRFSRICPDFRQIKTFLGVLLPPAPPASYTTAFQHFFQTTSKWL